MSLNDIGFYTLSDNRAKRIASESFVGIPHSRCELILTDKCNFKCPYCRGIRADCSGEMPFDDAVKILDSWIDSRLINVRFSGGEPMLYPHLDMLVRVCATGGMKRIAVSTNGSADLFDYKFLIRSGVNDFSISLDACCSMMGEKMNGNAQLWNKTVNNIRELSKLTYVTVGMVFDENNVADAKKAVEFAHSLGVADIRVISSAQYNKALSSLMELDDGILQSHPILNYRISNFKSNRNVRGIQETDCGRCSLVMDDMAVAGDYHFPCIIYLREGGKPIGKTNGDVVSDRRAWSITHNSHQDRICRENCLDVCIDHNNTVNKYRGLK